MRGLRLNQGVIVVLSCLCCTGYGEEVANQKNVVYLSVVTVAPRSDTRIDASDKQTLLIETYCKQAFKKIDDVVVVGHEANGKRNGYEFVFMLHVRPIEYEGKDAGFALAVSGSRKVSLEWAVKIYAATLGKEGLVPSDRVTWLAVHDSFLQLRTCEKADQLEGQIASMVDSFNSVVIERKRTGEIEHALDGIGPKR